MEKQIIPADEHDSMDGVSDLLGSVRKKGVRLWSEGGRLHYKAPRGVLTQEETERLRASKHQIAAILETTCDEQQLTAETTLGARKNRAPLAFSQLAHWHLYRLNERPARRQVASAKRLTGRLNINALRSAVTEVVRRHKALRTRIVVCDGTPMQEVDDYVRGKLEIIDLTSVTANSQEIEVQRQIEQLMLQPINLAIGPLFEARLLKLRNDEHVLIVAMEHMISDGFSLNILFRDLFMAYGQVMQGHPFCLPEIPMQFIDYAVQQRRSQESWSKTDGPYWDERLAGCRRVRFPEDVTLPRESVVGWGTIPLRIDATLKAELHEYCRQRRTTLAMGVLAIYTGLVLCWCRTSESVIRYACDGRLSSGVQNSIGYFASMLYLRVRLRAEDTFVDLLNQVVQEYCKAYEHADSSYLAAQVPCPEITRNTAFNWLPQWSSENKLSALDASEDAISCTEVSFGYPLLKELDVDREPGVLLYDVDEEILGELYFPFNRFSVDSMERFAHTFRRFIELSLRQPQTCVKDICL